MFSAPKARMYIFVAYVIVITSLISFIEVLMLNWNYVIMIITYNPIIFCAGVDPQRYTD